jgi:phosphoribulokinase
MHYGPDEYYGHSVSILEVDGTFDRLEEVIYIENHLSKTSTKFYGEMTELLLKHKEYPGSSNGSGLFQVLVGLKMRSTYERLIGGEVQMAAKAGVN